MTRADGSVSLSLAVIALGVLLALAVTDVGLYLDAGFRAATAADAAALAAAPLTFRGFGSSTGPRREAARLAAENGSRLVSCACRIDASWRGRTVAVVVERRVSLLLFGRRRVRAIGRAEFIPTEVGPRQPSSSVSAASSSRS